MQPVFRTSELRMFFNGVFSEPRLNHAEGIAIDRKGAVWCGGEEGELYRISPDGTGVELMAQSKGFALGVAVDARDYVYVCDMKFACVFRFDPETKRMTVFAEGMACPNYAILDEKRRWLYVSDSHENGPGIWRFNLDTGAGGLWYAGDCQFANGLAFAPNGDAIYVAESFASQISQIRIGPDGSAEEKTELVSLPGTVPDGLLVNADGTLYISCFEPSCIYRYRHGALELLVEDKQAQVLDHPTNLAITDDGELLIANLGAWHISALKLKED